ncbi:hypothetical protein DFP72DRAFT_1073016 [Ephemerocybe angulata]|uniref:Gylcosyl hydrolase 115 C-terminal domain-containing protein n=1 Tax=Ephemerocybe angulata TaxID=980116 RepID=A0A8H6M330_9AGAR|nr:hypothetical protein DFP72DRAFT_1073016 [Tulosesus angulatus]
MKRLSIFTALALLVPHAFGIGQQSCVSFKSDPSGFAVVSGRRAAPVLISEDDWPGVQRAAADFVADIQRVTGVKPTFKNATSANAAQGGGSGSLPIIIGTLGKSSLIDQVVNATKLDVSSLTGKWESYLSKRVENPLPGVSNAYVIIGSDKRGSIYALYDHSEQFGVSPWYWWADVPVTTQSNLFVSASGCSHGEPTVKYRGIFINDEQPALQNWAQEKFTNGTGAPFNHFFYSNVFELILRLRGNYLWPAMWAGKFGVDDLLNQFTADYYGVVMGTSHQEPMMRSTPNEFTGLGKWDYTTNKEAIKKYLKEGVERSKNFESVYTMGMRGFGDLPLSEDTNIQLMEGVIADQTQILKDVFQVGDVSGIPQVWALYKEVEDYYVHGLTVPDYVTLLWSDDNWGNIRGFLPPDKRNRTGGAGVYYHFDYVGDPRNFKWIISTQLQKVHEQLSIAVERASTRLWIVNIGDLKPYEREIEFFLGYGYNATRWTPNNINEYVTSWAQREFDVDAPTAGTINSIVANLTRYNSRRHPELWNATTYSLVNYREAETVLADWKSLEAASTKIYNSLPQSYKAAFFQLVHHPVIASANLQAIYVNAGWNNLRAVQARLSTNELAETVQKLFEVDYDIETQYHQLLNGKWNHIMDQTHVSYDYWQQPMQNSMPPITKVQARKQALPGVMRIAPEYTLGAWPGDNRNNCKDGYNCPDPTLSLNNFDNFNNRYVDVGAAGPNPFTFTVAANASWVRLSTSKGSISTKNTEQRVFLGVADWSQLSDGVNAALVTFTATSSKFPVSVVNVNFVATKNAVPAGFKGFVESQGVVSVEAAHHQRNTPVSDIAWTELPGLGKTLSGLTPLPRSAQSFEIGAGPSVEYDFLNFNTIGGSGNLTATFLLSPSLNAATDEKPLAFSVSLDGAAPIRIQPVPASSRKSDPPGWGTINGWVANAINKQTVLFTGIAPGKHTLKVSMMEPAVVLQKIVIDAGGIMESYLGPPESKIV